MLFKTATDKFNGPIYIVIVVAGILESSDLIDDSEQGTQQQKSRRKITYIRL